MQHKLSHLVPKPGAGAAIIAGAESNVTSWYIDIYTADAEMREKIHGMDDANVAIEITKVKLEIARLKAGVQKPQDVHSF